MESVVDLLFRIRKAGSGGKEGAGELNALGQAAKKVKQEFKDFKAIGQATQMAFSLVSNGIKAVADSAEHLGRTELKAAFQGAAEAGQDLQDTLMTLKVGGRDSIAWVTDAANGLKNLANLVNIAGVAWAQHAGHMSDAEASARAYAIAFQPVPLTTDQLAQAQRDLADPMDESNRLMREQKDALDAVARAEAEAKAQASEANQVYRDAKQALADSNIPLYEKKDLLEELAILTGELTPEEQENKAAVEALTKHLELGNIELAEYKALLDALATGASNASQVVHALADAVSGLPAMPYGAEDFAGAGGTAPPTQSGPLDEGQVPGGASGLHMQVPPGYPNDSFPMRAQSGEVVDIWRTPQERAQAMNMGGVTIIVNGAGSPMATAIEIERRLDRMGKSVDIRMRS